MSRSVATAHRSSSGFTLVEVLISSVVMCVVLGGVMATMIAFNGSFQNEAVIKGATEGSRATLAYLERVVSRTGYGIDPRFAFDFTTTGLPGTLKDNYSDTTVAPSSVPFVTDDLAIRFRDNMYTRRGHLNAAATQITLDSPTPTFSSPFASGQTFILACSSPSESVPGRPSIENIVLTAAAAAAATSTTLNVTQSGSPFETFGASPLRALPSCLTRTGLDAPVLMVLYTVRLRVVDLGGRPFLVAFHNLNAPDPTTNTDFDPIAADVEQFQVAYMMRRPTPTSTCCATQAAPDVAGNGNWLMGDVGDAANTLPTFSTTFPSYDTAYDDANRYNGFAGNIQGVRVTFSIRSRSTAPNNRRLAYPRFTPVENYTGTATKDGYYRQLTTTTVRSLNMASRSFFLPPTTAANLTTLNVGGG